MKMFKALGSGCKRSLKAWKAVILVWFFYLVLTFLVASVFKSSFTAGLGRSMITEKLAEGLNIDVFGDLGGNLSQMIRSFFSAISLLVLIWLLLNAFLTAGLFSSLRTVQGFSAADFFGSSAKYFWAFLGITVIVSLLIFLLGILMVFVPLSIVAAASSESESLPYTVAIISGAVFAIVVLIFFLVADYARAWQARNEVPSCFKALGFGFGRTFGRFLSSFPMILVLFLIQVLFALLVVFVVGPWRPAKSGGVFLLFILSQFIFFINLMLKTWRYGSVTSLMELNDQVQST